MSSPVPGMDSAINTLLACFEGCVGGVSGRSLPTHSIIDPAVYHGWTHTQRRPEGYRTMSGVPVRVSLDAASTEDLRRPYETTVHWDHRRDNRNEEETTGGQKRPQKTLGDHTALHGTTRMRRKPQNITEDLRKPHENTGQHKR